MDGITLERLGNLHLVFLHLPIGFVVAAVLVEFWRWRRPSAENAWLQGRLLAANAVASLLTAGAGLLLAANGKYDGDLVALHRWTGVACAGLAIAAWFVHARGRVWMARGTLGVLLAATVVAGHLGATLTHGPAATAFWPTGKPAAKNATTVPVAPVDTVFVKEIQPILTKACIDCHGPEKSKGRLRLDSREAALAGGKSGEPTLVPGKPEQSELLRRVKLPRDDDEAMPSDDGPGLTPAEIAALERWIAAGAAWH
ncbi:MAG: c-type cytochrome domain-containing protein [Rariglobus sp.]|nr:c-type cytochrome domain-containing protein [Rariglobus sp.]